jgi:hypothetical protein
VVKWQGPKRSCASFEFYDPCAMPGIVSDAGNDWKAIAAISCGAHGGLLCSNAAAAAFAGWLSLRLGVYNLAYWGQTS